MILIELLQKIEVYLREEDDLFMWLGLMLILVGSLAEQTRVGDIDEADSMCLFSGLNKQMEYNGVKSLKLVKDSKLPPIVIQRLFKPDQEGQQEFQMTEFMKLFASAIKKALDHIGEDHGFKPFSQGTPCQDCFKKENKDELHPVCKYANN